MKSLPEEQHPDQGKEVACTTSWFGSGLHDLVWISHANETKCDGKLEAQLALLCDIIFELHCTLCVCFMLLSLFSKIKDTMDTRACPILGMEVTVTPWSQNAPKHIEPLAQKRYQQQPPMHNTMTETNFETALAKVMEMPASDDKAAKIWQLRSKQATALALEGKPSHQMHFVGHMAVANASR